MTQANPNRRVKILHQAGRQVVEIPPDLEFDGEFAVMRKVGESLVLEPVKRASLLALLATLSPIEDDFSDLG